MSVLKISNRSHRGFFQAKGDSTGPPKRSEPSKTESPAKKIDDKKKEQTIRKIDLKKEETLVPPGTGVYIHY